MGCSVTDLCEMSQSQARELGSKENAGTGFVKMSAFSWVNEEGEMEFLSVKKNEKLMY